MEKHCPYIKRSYSGSTAPVCEATGLELYKDDNNEFFRQPQCPFTDQTTEECRLQPHVVPLFRYVTIVDFNGIERRIKEQYLPCSK